MEVMASALNYTAVYTLSSNLLKENESEAIEWRGLYGPWKAVLLRTLSGEIDVALGGFVLAPDINDDFSFTYTYSTDTFQFYATNGSISSGRTETWVAGIILHMIMISAFISLAMHPLRRKMRGRGADFGATGIMINFLQCRCP